MSHDTWIHRAVTYGVEPFARTAIRPNHVTMARLTTGIAAAILFAWGTREAQVWGCAIFVLSFVLDRADGILARIQGTMSQSGHMFDFISDAMSNTLVFIGIGIGLRHSWLGAWGVLFGMIAALGVFLAFWMSARIESRTGQGALGIGSAGGFDPDDAMLVVPVAIGFDYSIELIAVAVVSAPLFALLLLAFRWKMLWGPLSTRDASPARSSIDNRSRRQVPRR